MRINGIEIGNKPKDLEQYVDNISIRVFVPYVLKPGFEVKKFLNRKIAEDFVKEYNSHNPKKQAWVEGGDKYGKMSEM